jgi:serine/threonine protein kinase
LVHRDIKPSNVMFVREEGGDIAVKVIDFGLATSGFLGTPHFASPEQLEEREIEDRAPSAKAEATFALPEEAPSPAKPYLDENVQFTVFRPGSIEPLKWYPLVAFAHLSAKRPDAP